MVMPAVGAHPATMTATSASPIHIPEMADLILFSPSLYTFYPKDAHRHRKVPVSGSQIVVADLPLKLDVHGLVLRMSLRA
jgi:hypothetical protein